MSSPLEPPPPRAGLGNTFKRPIVNFTIPSTAGPGQARTVIASVLPPPLDTYVVPGFGVKYRSGIIYYGNGDDTSYIYDCIIDTVSAIQVVRHVGVVKSGAVQEHTVGGVQRPLVQTWSSSAGFIAHLFDSDLFEVQTNDDPVFRSFQMGSGGGISFNSGGDGGPFVVQVDGTITLTATGDEVHIRGDNAVDITANAGDITLSNTVNGDITLDVANNLFNFLNVNVLGGIVVNGRNIGLGMKAYISAVANSAGIGAEAVLLTTPAMDFKEGRAYAIHIRGNVFPSNANTFHFVRVRKTNLAGAFIANLAQISTPGVGAQQLFYDRVLVRRATGGGDLVGVQLALTGQHSAGTGTWTGAPNDVRYMYVEDIGLGSDWPNAPAIV